MIIACMHGLYICFGVDWAHAWVAPGDGQAAQGTKQASLAHNRNCSGRALHTSHHNAKHACAGLIIMHDDGEG